MLYTNIFSGNFSKLLISYFYFNHFLDSLRIKINKSNEIQLKFVQTFIIFIIPKKKKITTSIYYLKRLTKLKKKPTVNDALLYYSVNNYTGKKRAKGKNSYSTIIVVSVTRNRSIRAIIKGTSIELVTWNIVGGRISSGGK